MQRLPDPLDPWWVTEGHKMCRKCGEERLVKPIRDARGAQCFCAVCGHCWRAVEKEFDPKFSPGMP